MRIGIDARKILNPELGEAIGVGHYTYQLIRYLLKIDKKNEYVLFFDYRVREKDIEKFKQPNVKIRFYPFSHYGKYLPGAYNEILGAATLVKEELDLVHATSALSRIPSSYRGRMIVTVHDLSFFKVPEVYPKIFRTRSRTVTGMMVGKAEKVIAVSSSIKSDLSEMLKVPDEKVDVVYSGFDNRFLGASQVPREKVLEKYGVKDRYILFLGTLEPSKNIVRLLEAFRTFREKLAKDGKKNDYKLILAGKRGWLAQEYRQIAKDLGIEKNVRFAGYIIGDDLLPLFSEADFFVMPSLYEGFGATVLEALASGTPAIVSSVSSVPEIAGKAALYVDPIDTEGIARAMSMLARDEELKRRLKEEGRSQVRNFDWEKCARETLEIYNKLEEK